MIDVSTHLMFQDGSAREAVERYVELIPNSTITEVTGPEGPGQSSDGSVLMPLDDYGFSPLFGWCTDRHGVSWQVGCTTG